MSIAIKVLISIHNTLLIISIIPPHLIYIKYIIRVFIAHSRLRVHTFIYRVTILHMLEKYLFHFGQVMLRGQLSEGTHHVAHHLQDLLLEGVLVLPDLVERVDPREYLIVFGLCLRVKNVYQLLDFVQLIPAPDLLNVLLKMDNAIIDGVVNTCINY